MKKGISRLVFTIHFNLFSRLHRLNGGEIGKACLMLKMRFAFVFFPPIKQLAITDIVVLGDGATIF